jgi:hypothetical protein
MADMGLAVSRRRTIVESEGIAALTLINSLLGNALFFPEFLYFLLTGDEVKIGINFAIQKNPPKNILSLHPKQDAGFAYTYTTYLPRTIIRCFVTGRTGGAYRPEDFSLLLRSDVQPALLAPGSHQSRFAATFLRAYCLHQRIYILTKGILP